MATAKHLTDPKTREEYCGNCDEDTAHDVAIEQRATTDGDGVRDENRKFARVPTRVAICENCGAERTEQMSG